MKPSKDPATGDWVCEHGKAVDIHCCNCHPGFLFDAESCVCATARRLCACGCWEQEHDEATGRCAFCSEADCDGFTYDDEGTVIALATEQEES